MSQLYFLDNENKNRNRVAYNMFTIDYGTKHELIIDHLQIHTKEFLNRTEYQR